MRTEFKDVSRVTFQWVRGFTPRFFWNLLYPVLVPLALFAGAYYFGIIQLQSEGIVGWHISFENSLFFAFGVFFTLFIYKLESERHLADLSIEIEELKDGLFLSISNKSLKNYLKNVAAYVYLSDSKVTLKGHPGSTRNLTGLNSHKLKELGYYSGKCYKITIPFVPTIETYATPISVDVSSIAEGKSLNVNISVECTAENAASAKETFEIIALSSGKVGKINKI